MPIGSGDFFNGCYVLEKDDFYYERALFDDTMNAATPVKLPLLMVDWPDWVEFDDWYSNLTVHAVFLKCLGEDEATSTSGSVSSTPCRARNLESSNSPNPAGHLNLGTRTAYSCKTGDLSSSSFSMSDDESDDKHQSSSSESKEDEASFSLDCDSEHDEIESSKSFDFDRDSHVTPCQHVIHASDSEDDIPRPRGRRRRILLDDDEEEEEDN